MATSTTSPSEKKIPCFDCGGYATVYEAICKPTYKHQFADHFGFACATCDPRGWNSFDFQGLPELERWVEDKLREAAFISTHFAGEIAALPAPPTRQPKSDAYIDNIPF